MSDTTPLHDALLELGLEDWIALPEIKTTPEVRDLIDDDEEIIETVSRSLVELLLQGRIEVWSGHWKEEPTPVSAEVALPMLLDPRRYSFDTETGAIDRVYFVNVENFHS